MRRILTGAAAALACMAALTGAMLPLRGSVSIATMALVLVVPVVLGVVTGGFEAGIISVAAGFLAYDFFFIPPYLTLSVGAPQNWTALGVYAVVMLPVVTLTARGTGDLGVPFVAPASVWYFVLIVALPTLGSFLLMNRYQRLVSASEAGIIYATEPAFASAFALFLPGWLSNLSGISYADETLSSRLLWGGALVVSANVLLAIVQPEPKPPPERLGRALDSEA